MKRLLFIFLFLLAGTWLGLKIHADPGYLLISYRNVTVESTLWFALLGLLLSVVTLMLILRTGVKVLSAPSRMSRWLNSRAQHQAHHNTLSGLEDYLQGEWALAEKKLLHAIKHSKHPQINYLFAAKACAHLGHTDKAQSHMHQAQRGARIHSLAPSLTQVALYLSEKNEDAALDTLKQLQKQKPQHKGVTAKLARLYAQQQDWSALADLLPIIKRHRLMPKEHLDPLEIQTLVGILPATTHLKLLQTHWQQASKEAKQHPEVLKAYCDQLIVFEQSHEASKLLKKYLNKTWDDMLIPCFTPLCQSEAKGTLSLLLSLAKNNPESAPLHMGIGLCYYHQEMLGQAKNHLLQSSEINPNYTPVWRNLCHLAVEAKDYQQAYHYSEKANESQS